MVSAIAVDEKRLIEEFSDMIKQRLTVWTRTGGYGSNITLVTGWNANLEAKTPDEESWFKRVRLVDDAKKVALINDALEFYRDIRVLHLPHEARKEIALQLSFENNKVARAIESCRHLSEARQHTKVNRMNAMECIESQVDFIMKTGLLNKADADSISKVAKAAVESYKEGTKIVSAASTTVSAIAIYYASYKIDKPLSENQLAPILDVSAETLRNRTKELVRTAFPEDLEWWEKRRSRHPESFR